MIKKLKSRNYLFILMVALPTLLATVYYGLLASDVYISEARFVVRSPEKPSTSGLGILLKTAGFSNAGDEIFAAKDFIVSRDALAALNQRGEVTKAYGGDAVSIFDRFNPIGWDGSFENLYKYYNGKVSVEHDTASSITTLKVRAFTPQDAHSINRRLLEQSEALVNRLNTRGRADLIHFAQVEVQDAQRDATAAALALANYRNRHGVIDPERQATVQLQMISKLQDELIGAKTQLVQLQSIAANNPQVSTIKARINELQREIDDQVGQVAGDRGSLSATAAQFQRLQLEREFADRRLSAAMSSLQEARNEARRKQAYIERIVQPSLPDYPLEPRRLRGILAALVISFVVWSILSMLLASVKEHQD